MLLEYEEAPVTPQLLARLWENLWPRGIEELSRLGLRKYEGYMLFMGNAERADNAVILTHEKQPILVAGIVSENGESFTFMQASADFDSHALAIVRILRRWIKQYAPPSLYIYSVCVHPGTPKFFKVLGFLPDGWEGRTQAGYPLFRFQRR